MGVGRVRDGLQEAAAPHVRHTPAPIAPPTLRRPSLSVQHGALGCAGCSDGCGPARDAPPNTTRWRMRANKQAEGGSTAPHPQQGLPSTRACTHMRGRGECVWCGAVCTGITCTERSPPSLPPLPQPRHHPAFLMGSPHAQKPSGCRTSPRKRPTAATGSGAAVGLAAHTAPITIAATTSAHRWTDVRDAPAMLASVKTYPHIRMWTLLGVLLLAVAGWQQCEGTGAAYEDVARGSVCCPSSGMIVRAVAGLTRIAASPPPHPLFFVQAIWLPVPRDRTPMNPPPCPLPPFPAGLQVKLVPALSALRTHQPVRWAAPQSATRVCQASQHPHLALCTSLSRSCSCSLTCPSTTADITCSMWCVTLYCGRVCGGGGWWQARA
jgi:hypothetical protein